MGKGSKRKTVWRTLSIAEGVDDTMTSRTSHQVEGHSENHLPENDLNRNSEWKHSKRYTNSIDGSINRNNLPINNHSSTRYDYHHRSYYNNNDKYSSGKRNQSQPTTVNELTDISLTTFKRRPFSQQNQLPRYNGYNNNSYRRDGTRRNNHRRYEVNSTFDYNYCNANQNTNNNECPIDYSNVNKRIFNEDEYTRITTPRQDVLFKKGYLGRPKKCDTTRSLNSSSSIGSGTTSECGSLTHSFNQQSLSPDNMQTFATEAFDADVPIMYPSGFYDQNGYFYPFLPNNPYDGQLILMPFVNERNGPMSFNYHTNELNNVEVTEFDEKPVPTNTPNSMSPSLSPIPSDQHLKQVEIENEQLSQRIEESASDSPKSSDVDCAAVERSTDESTIESNGIEQNGQIDVIEVNHQMNDDTLDSKVDNNDNVNIDIQENIPSVDSNDPVPLQYFPPTPYYYPYVMGPVPPYVPNDDETDLSNNFNPYSTYHLNGLPRKHGRPWRRSRDQYSQLAYHSTDNNTDVPECNGEATEEKEIIKSESNPEPIVNDIIEEVQVDETIKPIEIDDVIANTNLNTNVSEFVPRSSKQENVTPVYLYPLLLSPRPDVIAPSTIWFKSILNAEVPEFCPRNYQSMGGDESKVEETTAQPENGVTQIENVTNEPIETIEKSKNDAVDTPTLSKFCTGLCAPPWCRDEECAASEDSNWNDQKHFNKTIEIDTEKAKLPDEINSKTSCTSITANNSNDKINDSKADSGIKKFATADKRIHNRNKVKYNKSSPYNVTNNAANKWRQYDNEEKQDRAPPSDVRTKPVAAQPSTISVQTQQVPNKTSIKKNVPDVPVNDVLPVSISATATDVTVKENTHITNVPTYAQMLSPVAPVKLNDIADVQPAQTIIAPVTNKSKINKSKKKVLTKPESKTNDSQIQSKSSKANELKTPNGNDKIASAQSTKKLATPKWQTVRPKGRKRFVYNDDITDDSWSDLDEQIEQIEDVHKCIKAEKIDNVVVAEVVTTENDIKLTSNEESTNLPETLVEKPSQPESNVPVQLHKKRRSTLKKQSKKQVSSETAPSVEADEQPSPVVQENPVNKSKDSPANVLVLKAMPSEVDTRLKVNGALAGHHVIRNMSLTDFGCFDFNSSIFSKHMANQSCRQSPFSIVNATLRSNAQSLQTTSLTNGTSIPKESSLEPQIKSRPLSKINKAALQVATPIRFDFMQGTSPVRDIQIVKEEEEMVIKIMRQISDHDRKDNQPLYARTNVEQSSVKENGVCNGKSKKNIVHQSIDNDAKELDSNERINGASENGNDLIKKQSFCNGQPNGGINDGAIHTNGDSEHIDIKGIANGHLTNGNEQTKRKETNLCNGNSNYIIQPVNNFLEVSSSGPGERDTTPDRNGTLNITRECNASQKSVSSNKLDGKTRPTTFGLQLSQSENPIMLNSITNINKNLVAENIENNNVNEMIDELEHNKCIHVRSQGISKPNVNDSTENLIFYKNVIDNYKLHGDYNTIVTSHNSDSDEMTVGFCSSSEDEVIELETVAPQRMIESPHTSEDSGILELQERIEADFTTAVPRKKVCTVNVDTIAIPYNDVSTENDQSKTAISFPITQAVSQWLRETKREQTPQSIFILPIDNKVLTESIDDQSHIDYVKTADRICKEIQMNQTDGIDRIDNVAPSDSESDEEDIYFDKSTYDNKNEHQQGQQHEQQQEKEHQEQLMQSKNLHGNPLAATSLKLEDITADEWVAISLTSQDDLLNCWDGDDLIPTDDQKHTDQFIRDSTPSDMSTNDGVKSMGTNGSNAHIDIYDSVYGHSIDYTNLLSNKENHLSKAILNYDNSRNGLTTNSQKIATEIDDNAEHVSTNINDDCMKPDKTTASIKKPEHYYKPPEICCNLM